MEDAPEEDLDIKLQTVSKDLIADFDARLRPFLRKADGAGRVRSRVRGREVTFLMSNLLDPFQELPQLLDPHLPKWLPVLAEAFLEYQQTRRRHAAEASSTSSLLMPLPTAVCKLIYTFCKIRGEKVIANFLNVETRYLELLLSAIEESERHLGSEGTVPQWSWEERYVVLLWLSHLMFAPFDLATISSVYMHDVDLAGVPGFLWPFNPPSITVRILPLATKYLASPGKERDAAKNLLVRMAMRRDMQKLGILQALLDWALFSLHPSPDDSDSAAKHNSKYEVDQNPYNFIGVLAFLAGVLSSADTSEVAKYSSKVFYTVNATMCSDDATSTIISSSAVARKTVIKVMRSISLSKLTRESRDMSGIQLVETTVRHLLRSLSDKDTPVRFAASKALGAITLKLPNDMASQVVAAVLQALKEHVRLAEQGPNSSLSSWQPLKSDLRSVDPLEWHGLMLTLSHLLYRRSPPPESLGDILQALLLGLSFEQRSASGVSIGANVRDAACFGIWAVARRYSTQELLAVNHETLNRERNGSSNGSILQLLATHLVVTACLDPAGNIRRGSSAALQELIGRHPDTVENGIAVVQTVDYHAVALRSRAMQDVALAVTKLHSQYGVAILEAVLDWRGLGDANDRVRRYAGASYGMITAELTRVSSTSTEVIFKSVDAIASSIRVLQPRQVEERHGLLLAMASIMDQLPRLVTSCQDNPQQLALVLQKMLSELEWNLKFIEATTFRRPDLIAEASSRLFTSSLPVFQASHRGIHAITPEELVTAPYLLSFLKTSAAGTAVFRLAELSVSNELPLTWVNELIPKILNGYLLRTEEMVVEAVSEAAVALLLLLEPARRDELIESWANAVTNAQRGGSIKGHLMALTRSHAVIRMSPEETKHRVLELIPRTLLQCWAKDITVEARVWILESLVEGDVMKYHAQRLLQLITEALEDYTTDARGDVGSHIRLHAIQATKHLWSMMEDLETRLGGEATQAAASRLLLPIMRLGAEKLDKVRPEAQSTLCLALSSDSSAELGKRSCSSQDYFYFLLDLTTHQNWLNETFQVDEGPTPQEWMDELLAGYVASADTGNEDLVIASRSALCEYSRASQENLDLVCASLYRNMKARQGQDRITVPTLEIIAFLLSMGLYQRTKTVDFKNLCLQAQKASYKTGNVRKLIACVKVYGGIASMGKGCDGLPPMATEALGQKRLEAVAEARKRLGALMLHPWPRVRTAVVDELWNVLSGQEDEMAERLKGVDWGSAEKDVLKRFGTDLSL